LFSLFQILHGQKHYDKIREPLVHYLIVGSVSIGEAAQETGDVEQRTPIGAAALLAGQITDIASKAAVV
jgi:hypothetical protein